MYDFYILSTTLFFSIFVILLIKVVLKKYFDINLTPEDEKISNFGEVFRIILTLTIFLIVFLCVRYLFLGSL